MVRLSNRDLQRVLDSIAMLNTAMDLASLRERTLECATRLVPNSTMTAFDGLDPEGVYNGSLWYSPPGTVPPERVELFAQLVHEHPYANDFFATKDEQIYRISDRLPLAKFHRTTVFNEFYRLFEGESQIATVFRLSATSLVTCSFHRPRVDFSDSEVEMLRLVTPHLKAAFKNAQYLEQLDRHRNYLDGIVSKGLIIIGENGTILFESRLAQEWLRKYFSETFDRGLPAALVEGINAVSGFGGDKEYYRPVEGLNFADGDCELQVRFSFDNRQREVIILLEERRPYERGDFCQSGITGREADILFWISRGKTDPEIAALLSISPRTVQKHVEHILAKFGVETRTAAVMHALSLR